MINKFLLVVIVLIVLLPCSACGDGEIPQPNWEEAHFEVDYYGDSYPGPWTGLISLALAIIAILAVVLTMISSAVVICGAVMA